MNVEGSVRGKLITTLIVDTHVLATVIFFQFKSKSKVMVKTSFHGLFKIDRSETFPIKTHLRKWDL